jgi:group I intron endonuclease
MFTNNVNKKIYIGKTTRLNERIKNYSDSHWLKKSLNSKISRAIIKFGAHNFSFSIIETCSKESLNAKKQFYIDTFKPQYNIRKIVHKTI